MFSESAAAELMRLKNRSRSSILDLEFVDIAYPRSTRAPGSY